MKRLLPAAGLVIAALTSVSCSQTPEQAARSTVAKTKFRVAEIKDDKQGGLVAVRYAVPEDWKSDGRIEWNYSDLYTPFKAYSRAEAPDGSAWLETYPAELFYWLDGRWDNFPQGKGGVGGIHHTKIDLSTAMQRYVIQRYRGKVKNLQILGSRPVVGLGKAVHQPTVEGEGIDFRVRYEMGSDVVDEEFFGLMTPVVTIPYHGPQGTTYEYHRALVLVHSLGAKQGKLESVRPLLGFMAGSFESDKVWQQHQQAVVKQLNDAFQRNLAAGYAQIEAAGRLSRAISANNDAMISAMDSQRAAANARASSRPTDSGGSAYSAADNFDLYIRDAERMTDSSGQVSEQPNAYSYHWTDGFGTFVHSNDATFNPNDHSNQTYEKLTPAH